MSVSRSSESLGFLDNLPAAPWWAFALHWPIVSGRELMWGCWTTTAVPLMKLLQISETVISAMSGISASLAVLLALSIAYTSGEFFPDHLVVVFCPLID